MRHLPLNSAKVLEVYNIYILHFIITISFFVSIVLPSSARKHFYGNWCQYNLGNEPKCLPLCFQGRHTVMTTIILSMLRRWQRRPNRYVLVWHNECEKKGCGRSILRTIRHLKRVQDPSSYDIKRCIEEKSVQRVWWLVIILCSQFSCIRV